MLTDKEFKIVKKTLEIASNKSSDMTSCGFIATDDVIELLSVFVDDERRPSGPVHRSLTEIHEK
jgi:hypothetical protein